MDLQNRLRLQPGRKVLLCVGPGGVGKTTVAASIALQAAKLGRKVIVVTIDPSRRLGQALGLDQDEADGQLARGHIVRVPGLGQTQLDCMLLDTRQVFDAIVRGYSTPDAGERMLANPIYQATVEHLGGALEYAATARVHMLHASGQYDLVVLDTPPTANAIEFLEAPGRIDEILNNPAAKFLANSGRTGMRFFGLASGVMLKAFEAIGGGPFMRQIGEFLQDFGGILGEFQRRAGDVARLLTSPETGVVLTTAATEFSVREASVFLDVLVERGLRIDGVVLNRADSLLPPRPADDVLTAALERVRPGEAAELLPRVTKAYSNARAQSERTQQVAAELRQRLTNIPVRVLERMEPPPTTLADLEAMGAAVLAL